MVVSGRKHLILTGSIGSGKTTLHGRILKLISKDKIAGITSWLKPMDGVYIRDNITLEECMVGKFNFNSTDEKCKMTLIPEGFLELGISSITRAINSKDEWFSIDEIGFLETGCEEYCNEILNLMNKKRLIACVRKQELPFLQMIIKRDDVLVVDLDKPYGDVGCVIMASGLGKRFGSNKLMADFDGKSLIEQILDTTEGIFQKRVVVTRHDNVRKLCQEKGVEVLYHDLPLRSDTVRLGISTMDKYIRGCMFCPGDQPLLNEDTIMGMAVCACNDKDMMWRLSYGDEKGMPVLFPKWTFEELKSLPEGKGGNVLIKKYPLYVRNFPAESKWELCDVDYQRDIEKLKEIKKSTDKK